MVIWTYKYSIYFNINYVLGLFQQTKIGCFGSHPLSARKLFSGPWILGRHNPPVLATLTRYPTRCRTHMILLMLRLLCVVLPVGLCAALRAGIWWVCQLKTKLGNVKGKRRSSKKYFDRLFAFWETALPGLVQCFQMYHSHSLQSLTSSISHLSKHKLS